MVGEEYGWRFFLQEKLQNKFGKRKGIVILGLIWGLWHINNTIFSDFNLGIIIAVTIFNSVYSSIVYAYICKKTGSFWTAVFLHLAGNSLGLYLMDIDITSIKNIYSYQINGRVIIWYVLISFIGMMFFMSKELKK